VDYCRIVIADDLQPLARPIDTLHLLDGNPRRGDVEAVARSYQRFGQRKPIVARRDGTVIAGNHQLLAARSLGWTEIAVVYVDDDDLTASAFALADNRISDLGSYDETDLRSMLEDVAVDLDLLLATGYDEETLRMLQRDVTDDDWQSALGGLPSGDKEPFQQMTFTVHDDQADIIREALERANTLGDYDSPNTNRNGNAIARVCETFLTMIGPR
jgi:hypothetical protein